ncbi:hypothetical protein DSAG12_03819 [Promethearchaeum syntrophicum]|uniref:DNA primase large subunit C-terminal domain-containing protein n=1 Tax=Promethearchaeum syntrophicum TaxID=2594042 RepID=A0A5B9DG36_9ARCH|nr:hypothetical protein [Candidatus Prometheoarchaeum syntrophicum]QEE17981.1 DNA primase large subunit PriL [Candidatus Prometheoarchaeum syntrophicum]
MEIVQKYNLPKQLFLQFPWLNESSQILFEELDIAEEKIGSLSLIEMVQFLFKEYPTLLERIKQFFSNIIQSKEEFSTPTGDGIHLAMYPILQIIVSISGNRVLGNALTNLFAKHSQEELSDYNKKKIYTNNILQHIFSNLGISCMVEENIYKNGIKYPFQMDFPSYLSVSTKIRNDSWKLINRYFEDGKIYLIRHDVILLLREFVRQKTQPDYKQINKELSSQMEKIPEITEILNEISTLMATHKKRFESSIFSEGETIGSELYPPCIKAILYSVMHGENLSHNERLAIAFFYLNTNHSIEETVDIFRTSPDFDEDIARYQTEFAAGSGGKGKKYSMYKCAKLKSLHLCRATDPNFGDKLCRDGAKKRSGEIVPIQNPAKDFIFWKKVALNRLHRSQIIDQLESSDEAEINRKKEEDSK